MIMIGIVTVSVIVIRTCDCERAEFTITGTLYVCGGC